MGTVIILGAKGRFGRAAVGAFQDAGWDVRAFGRALAADALPGITCIEGDGQDAQALRQACQGVDVIVHAINPPYPAWPTEMPGLTRNVIKAAQATGASVLIPGNIYNYGAGMPSVLAEDTPWAPTTGKGQLRVEMEECFRQSGVRTIVLRSGDFFEAEDSGDWFGHYITAQSHLGKTLYPGPLDVIHAWGYLPDMARAAVGLAEKLAEFAKFEEFSFAGYAVTGQALLAEIGQALGVTQRHKKMPWAIVHLLGLFNPLMSEVHEMRYLWHVPHQVDGAKLRRVLPDFQPTPFAQAITLSLARSIAQIPN